MVEEEERQFKGVSMSLLKGLINQVKQCPLGTIALLLFILLILFSSADKTNTDKGTFIVLTLTLFALVWYSYETHKMVKIQYETYQASRRPLLSINVQSSQDVKHTTFFQLKNHRDYFTEVWVYAELRFNNQPRPISDHYNGKKSWLIQPKDGISAPIELPKVVFSESFGYTVAEINSFLG